MLQYWGRWKLRPNSGRWFIFRHRLIAVLILILGIQTIGAIPKWGVSQSAAADCTSSQFTITKKHNSVFYYDDGTDITSGYAQYLITNKGASAAYWAKITNFTGGALSLAAHESAIRSLGTLAASTGTINAYWYLTASAISDSAQNFDIEFYSADPTPGGLTPICKLTGGFTKTASTIKASANKVTSVTYSAGISVGNTFTATIKGNTGTIGTGPTGDNDVNLNPATNANFAAENFRLISTTFKCDAAASTINDTLFIANPPSCTRNDAYTAVFTFSYLSSSFASGASVKLSPIMQIASGTQMKHTDPPAAGVVGNIVDAPAGVTTVGSDTVTATSAYVYGNIDGGTMTSDYFCYQATTSPGSHFASNCTDSVTAITGSPNNYKNITGLTPGTKYYFEYIGYNGTSYYYGGVKSFTTQYAGVLDTTTAVSSLTYNSARFNGEQTGLTSGQISQYYFIFDDANPGTHFSLTGNETVTATTADSYATFYADKTGLTGSTTYYYELIIKDNVGGYYYGGVVNFTTPAAPSGGGGAPPPPPPPPTPPTVTSVSKTPICSLGEFVTIRGTNLAGATVKVDGVSARVAESASTYLIAIMPELYEGVKTIVVTNPDGSASISITYTFVDTPVFNNVVTDQLYVNRDVLYVFTASNTVSYSITGTLPPGLTYNPLTSTLSGTPTTTGNYTFTIVATNGCGSASKTTTLNVDKEIPEAFSCTVTFPSKNSNIIQVYKLPSLIDCLNKIKDLDPNTVDPLIFLSGGNPSNEPPGSSPTATARYNEICDVLLTQNLIAQIITGVFFGPPDEIEIIVYWPVP